MEKDVNRAGTAASQGPLQFRSMHFQLVIGPDGSRRFTYLSPSVRELYFVTPEQALADPDLLVDRCHPQDRPRVELALAEALRTMTTFRAELRLLEPTGGERWSSVMATPTPLPGGSSRWDGLEIDITGFKAREQAMLDRERLFRESQQAADIGSYQTDFVAGTWASSEVLDHIFGIGPGYTRDVDGWLHVVAPEDREGMGSYLQEQVIGRRQRFNREYRIIRQDDGQQRWVLGLGEVACDEAGRVVGLIGTIQDITERKRADQQRELLTTAVEQAAEAVVITDASGSIEYVNPAFERISGYSRAEALGQNPRLLKSGQQDEGFYRDLWQCISGGRTWRGILYNKRKDGALFIEEATISPVVDAQGGILSYVAVKHDITERLRLEAQFRQSQKMETVGRLAGGVAHDFNNLLGVIFSITELELMNVDESHPFHASLLGIQNAARRAVDLTKQLMAFARKQTIAPKVLDLNATVVGMLGMLERLIGEDIRLHWRPQAGLGLVKVDPSQVDQVLANLCVNARDAIAGPGEISIETAEVGLDAAFCAGREGLEPGLYAVLSVHDNGRGMDAATLSQVFEPFFTTKGVGRGTGLGLAIVYGIAKQNHGFVEASSGPDQGSTFRFYLPRHLTSAVAAVAPAPASSEPCLATVLLVEDEPALLDLTAAMLRRMGCNVLAAGSPQVALALAEQHGAGLDLVLTDVVMPGMNGGELVSQLSAALPGLKALFMSGYTANIIARYGVLEEGMNFIQKPFTYSQLSSQVHHALGAP